MVNVLGSEHSRHLVLLKWTVCRNDATPLQVIQVQLRFRVRHGHGSISIHPSASLYQLLITRFTWTTAHICH